MIRAVLDANVFVSGILQPQGAPGAVLAAWREDRFRLLASMDILRELGRVLAYLRISRRHRWSRGTIRTFVESVARSAFLTPGGLRLRVVVRDPDDDGYLECAVEGLADFLVTGDSQLL